MNDNLLVVQPILVPYRIPLFDDLAKRFDKVTVLSESLPLEKSGKCSKFSFFHLKIKWFGLFGLYWCSAIQFYKAAKTNKYIIHFGDFKFVSIYYSILLRFIFNKKVYVHGQGGYKRRGVLKFFIYNLLLCFIDGYIAYNEFSANTLKTFLLKRFHHKISYVNNSLYLNPVLEVCKRPDRSVAFIGRLRARTNIDLLVEACSITGLVLHMVGMVEDSEKQRILAKYDQVIFHGSIYDGEEIKRILSKCIAGVYPGDAGLSVVHYMAIALPVLVHSSIFDHMGPEAAFIKNGFNGCLYQRGNVLEVAELLGKLSSDLQFRNFLAERALLTFEQLNENSMAFQFHSILMRCK